MFDTRDANKEKPGHHHLSGTVALLGPPPIALLRGSPDADEYFDEHGQSLSLPDQVSNLLFSRQSSRKRCRSKYLFGRVRRKPRRIQQRNVSHLHQEDVAMAS